MYPSSSVAQSGFTALRMLRAPPVHLPPPAAETTDLFTVSTVPPFPECRRVGIIQYADFSD